MYLRISRRNVAAILTVFILAMLTLGGCKNARSTTSTSADSLTKLPVVKVAYGSKKIAEGETVDRVTGNKLKISAVLPKRCIGQLLLDGVNVAKFSSGNNVWQTTDVVSDHTSRLVHDGTHRVTLNLYRPNSGTKIGTVYKTFSTVNCKNKLAT